MDMFKFRNNKISKIETCTIYDIYIHIFEIWRVSVTLKLSKYQFSIMFNFSFNYYMQLITNAIFEINW